MFLQGASDDLRSGMRVVGAVFLQFLPLIDFSHALLAGIVIFLEQEISA